MNNTVPEVKCTCVAWEMSAPQIWEAQSLAHFHGVTYTGAYFAYCPWCGRHIGGATAGLWHVGDNWRVHRYMPLVCSQCRMHEDDSRTFAAGDWDAAVEILKAAIEARDKRIAELEARVAELEIEVANRDEWLSEWSGSYPRKDAKP